MGRLWQHFHRSFFSLLGKGRGGREEREDVRNLLTFSQPSLPSAWLGFGNLPAYLIFFPECSVKGRVKVTLQDSIQKINKNKRKIAPPKGLCEMTELWHIGKDCRWGILEKRVDGRINIGTIVQYFSGLSEWEIPQSSLEWKNGRWVKQWKTMGDVTIRCCRLRTWMSLNDWDIQRRFKFLLAL